MRHRRTLEITLDRKGSNFGQAIAVSNDREGGGRGVRTRRRSPQSSGPDLDERPDLDRSHFRPTTAPFARARFHSGDLGRHSDSKPRHSCALGSWGGSSALSSAPEALARPRARQQSRRGVAVRCNNFSSIQSKRVPRARDRTARIAHDENTRAMSPSRKMAFPEYRSSAGG